MRKPKLRPLAAVAIASALLLQSCKDDAYLADPAPVADGSLIEEFDTVSVSYTKGWKMVNASTPRIPMITSLLWEQSGDVIPWFNAYSENGSNVGFIGAGAELTAAVPPALGVPVVSNWLISPPVTFQNGDKISFYTRTRFFDAFNDYGNRLQLRAAFSESENVGMGDDAGAFTVGLVDINPSYANQSRTSPTPLAYPADWTRFVATISGLNQPVKGRFAFRYYIADANANGWGVGLDKVEYRSASRK